MRSRSESAIAVSSSQDSGGANGRVAARENIEFARLQFENHGPCRRAPSLREAVHTFSARRRISASVSERWNVPLERIFGRDRFGGPVRNNPAMIDTPGEFVEAYAIASKVSFQAADSKAEIADRQYAELLQSASVTFRHRECVRPVMAEERSAQSSG